MIGRWILLKARLVFDFECHDYFSSVCICAQCLCQSLTYYEILRSYSVQRFYKIHFVKLVIEIIDKKRDMSVMGKKT